MRLGRLFLGVIVILFSLWVILGEQITGVSSDAVVNARLTTVRTPIAGKLDMPQRILGAYIRRGDSLAIIADPLVDTVRLNDLKMERVFTIAEIAELTEVSIETDAEILGLQKRLDAYHAARMAEIDIRIARAQERVNLMSPASDTSSATRAADSIRLSMALEDLQTLRNSREAMNNDVFLGDGYNDTPVSGDRLIERTAYRATLETSLNEARKRLAGLEERIESEKALFTLLSTADLTAPSEGILWEVLADDGEFVQRGQDVLKLMLCDTALITLSVPGYVYNGLQVGQAAKFRLDGGTVVYDGTIARIAGSGAETIYRNLAVAPSIKHLERFDIALLVPELREHTDLRCTVGQTGRVFFDKRPLDWLRDRLKQYG